MKNFIAEIFDKRKSDKNADKLSREFMPSALEIAETPASPLGSFIIMFIFFIMFTFIVWASLSKVDEVAVSRGKIVPNGRVKIVQTLEEGIVNNILVEEGERVKKGQVLLELDTKMKEIDKDFIEKNIMIAKIEKELLEKYLDGVDDQSLKDFVEGISLSREIKDDLLDFSLSRRKAYSSKKQLLFLAVKKAENDLASAKEELVKLSKNRDILLSNETILSSDSGEVDAVDVSLEMLSEKIEILTVELEKHKKLLNSGLISEKEYLDKSNELEFAKKEYEINKLKNSEDDKERNLSKKSISDRSQLLDNDINLQKIKIKDMEINLDKAKSNLENFDKDNRATTLDEIVKKQKDIESLESSLEKSNESISYQTITSPVNGVVSGMKLNTVGGVIKPAESIMAIVPDDTPLIIEAMVENKDIGYIECGQKTSIKVDTFSFQKYGLLEGEVYQISPDSFEDERYGLVYKMKVKFNEKAMNIEGKEVALNSGMSVIVEVKTGERRVIEFLLEPLVKYLSEAFSLR